MTLSTPDTARRTAFLMRVGPVISGFSARLVLLLAGLIVGSAAAVAQSSDTNWWDGLRGFGTPSFGTPPKPERTVATREEGPDDLRPGDIPWRSDEMLADIDRAIEQYRAIVSRGGWPAIKSPRLIRPGDDDERVPVVRRILRQTGDLRGGTSYFEDYSFDSALEDAVRRFQARHGLRVNGRVDRSTIAALSIPAEERLNQLELNRRRIAALLETALEERYVLVNVPAYQLEAVERFQVAQRHRVIAGRPARETPELRATIKALNFYPHWRVPDSVAKLDVFPRLVKEPDYLDKEGIRVVMGDFNGPEIDPTSIDWSLADPAKVKLRQDPGPKNALGLVRIDMQNEHGVYMHDTPLKNLFTQSGRAFSAGCVRVQNVFELVEWIARLEPGWGAPGQVDAVLQAGQPLTLELTRPIPVYFAYITAWAERNGPVQFRTDIYNRDGHSEIADVADPDEPPPPPAGLAP